MKCHVNVADKEMVETNCEEPNNKLCAYVDTAGKISRSCSPNEANGTSVQVGCTKATMLVEITTCYCDTDNCNHECTADNCKKEAALEVCDAKCKAPGGGGSGGATDGDGKGTKTPTGTPATGGGNQRVVETNQLVFIVWVLVTLTIGSF